MQDFDTLRDRVEATTEKLKFTQADRQDQTETLVVILQRLEEKHAAQAQQLTYYQKRLLPLEQANHQLTALMENLLDLIDGGFGDESLAPLRDASSMAASMLESDLFLPGQEAPVEPGADESLDEDATAEAASQPVEAVLDDDEPAMELSEDADLTAETEEEAAPDDDEPAMDQSLDPDFEADEPAMEDALAEAAVEEDAVSEGDGTTGDSDLEMEEDALISLDDLLDLASEEGPEETVAFEDMDQDEPVAAMEQEVAEEEFSAADPVDPVAVSILEPEAVADDDIIDDGGFDAEIFAEDAEQPVASFEEVSDATLEFETEEDTAAGIDDLPDVVRDAMAAAQGVDEVDRVSENPGMEDETETEAVAEAAAASEDDLETIAALAQAIEEETANDDAPPPAQSDIRALLLRVEKLAKKAEAMRLAQGVPDAPKETAQAKTEKPRKQAGAAA